MPGILRHPAFSVLEGIYVNDLDKDYTDICARCGYIVVSVHAFHWGCARGVQVVFVKLVILNSIIYVLVQVQQ